MRQGRTVISISLLTVAWDRVRISYWFVPTLMLVTAICCALGAVRLDVLLGTHSERQFFWFDGMQAEAARKILATVASTMITVAGVVFSITIVALQLASSQFGPRLLRNFMSDTGNQIVLGTFTSAFVYCLLVLATVRSASDGNPGFVPAIATALGLFFGVASIGVLIFFIHHAAGQIRVENVVDRISREIAWSLQGLFPPSVAAEPESPADDFTLPEAFDRGAQQIGSNRSGYVRFIDIDALLETAERSDVVVGIDVRPGDFVVQGSALLSVWPGEPIDEATVQDLRSKVFVGADRTPLQDAKYALQQLTQIALRALSPAINDPYTATECIHRLSEGLHHAAPLPRPMRHRTDSRGRVRVIGHAETLAALTIYALDPIAAAGRDNGMVTATVLQALALIGRDARYQDDHNRLVEFAKLVRDGSIHRLDRARDIEVVEHAFNGLRRQLVLQPGFER